MTGGSHLSVRGREEAAYLFGFDFPGPWVACGTGPNGFPGVLFYFYFLSSFLFLFSYSFKTFAKILQFKPNFFQRFSIGKHNILSQ
jgi:hypothetical protein